MALIAILEDDEDRVEAMGGALEELGLIHRTFFFDNAPEMIAWLEENLDRVSVISLGRVLRATRVREVGPSHPGEGGDVAAWLAQRASACPVLLHTLDPKGRDGMHAALKAAGWTVDSVTPDNDLEWVRRAWIQRVRELFGTGGV